MLRKILVIIASIVFGIKFCIAQPGKVDTTFNSWDGGAIGQVNSIIQLSSGKILIGGYFIQYNNYNLNRLALLNSDGVLDTNFNYSYGPNSTTYSMVEQADNKIILGGEFDHIGTYASSRIARLTQDGYLDTTFIVGLGFNDIVKEVKLQGSNKILVGGGFTTFNNQVASRFCRLNLNGSLDTTFQNLGLDGSVESILLRPNGQILVTGDFHHYGNYNTFRIALLDSNGVIDQTFSSVPGASHNILDALNQSENRIILVGNFQTYELQ